MCWRGIESLERGEKEPLLLFFCFLQQRSQSFNGDAEIPARKAVHVGGVDADDFSLGVEDRAAAAAVGSGRVIDQLVADHVAEMAAGGGRANQRECSQFAGGA